MWFPNESPKIEPARFKNNSKVIYTDKNGVDHNAIALESSFKSLMTGYVYKIELEEPIDGHKNFLVNESRLSKPVAKKKTTKKEETAE